MQTLINKFRELSRNTQIAIIIAVCVFTPIVAIIGSVLGFVLGFVKWSVAIPMLLIFVGYKAYDVLFNTEDEEEEEEDIFNPFA
jgi:CHASE2 domain-containing sensor protein